MTMPEIFALFCTCEAPSSVLDAIIDATPNRHSEQNSMLSIIRNPEQREYDRPSNKPVQSFHSGFLGYSLADLWAFIRENFEMSNDHFDNIAMHAFVVVDDRCIKGENNDKDGSKSNGQALRDRTVLVVQTEEGHIEHMRVALADLEDVLSPMCPGGEVFITDLRNGGYIDEKGVYCLVLRPRQ